MAKQKAKTVDMSVSEEELDQIVLPEEAEAQRLKELKEQEKAEKEAKKAAKEAKQEEIQEKIEAKTEEAKAKPKKTRGQKVRSKRYHAIKNQIDRKQAYALGKAVELLQKSSYTQFVGTVTADLVLKDQKMSAEVSFPHSTGRTVRVAIATDALLGKIEKGELDFDVLVAEPKLMPKLAKFARILGPKGLMPNPKNQTVTPNPEKRKQELEAGKVTLKPEKKAPLMHVTVGKTDLEPKALQENLEALIKALGPKRIVKLVISATMSPGIKVDLAPYQSI